MLAAREDAIVEVVRRLLAEKGYEAMTVDEVAAEVGIAKASLYKHFPSKEDLACATVARAMREALDFVRRQPAGARATDKLKAAVRWALRRQLAGQMPSLPSHHSTLRAALVAHRECTDELSALGGVIGAWIEAAQADGDMDATLPRDVILCTLYARACDPLLDFLKSGDRHSDEQIIDWAVAACFDGLAGSKRPLHNSISRST